jgi:subtilisin family serine protease/acetyltransferase-like isoleucine patch superfamily enzyme
MMVSKPVKRTLTWQSLTAVGMAFSLFLGIFVHDRAHAQTSTKPKSDAAMLQRYTRDLTAAAEQGQFDSFTENQAGIKKAIEILARGSQNNPVVLTESQAIRYVVIAGVARRIVRGEVPDALLGRRVLKLDLETLFQDAKNLEDLKIAIIAVLAEATKADRRVILFVDPIQALVGASAAFDATVSDIMREVLAAGEVQMVGASSPATFEQTVSHDEQLASLFAGIDINEKTEDAAQPDDAIENENSATSDPFTGEKISSELSEIVAGSNASARVKVILQVDDVRNPELRAQFAKFGITINQEIPRFGTIAVEAPAAAVSALAANTTTNYLSLDRQVNGLGHVENTTGDTAMLANYPGTDGSGIGVAVVDSGISPKQKSLAGRIIYSRDFTGEGTTDDRYGHGTFVASMIAAKQGSYGGVATAANLLNLRVLDSEGRGSVSATLYALSFVFANRALYNIRVVNLSLGTAAIDSYKNDPLCRAIRRLVDAGVVVVTSAGNDGKDATNPKIYGRIHSPGNEPSAITVGAANTFGTDIRSDDAVTTFSSRGPTRSFWQDANGVRHYDNLMKPDLIAPGNKIIGAAAPKNKIEEANPDLCVARCDNNSGKGNMRLSGTSVSSPIVAGAAAVLLEANPSLTPNMIKMILMYTAQPLKGFNMLEQGAGELNIEGAVRLGKSIRPNVVGAVLGAPMLNGAAPVPSSIIAGETCTWSQGIILNHDWAAGSELITKYQPIYGLGVLLSDGVLISDGVLLSDMTMLSSGVLVGDHILISNGITMSDGIPLISSSVLLGDGVLLSDGVLIGDGVVLPDGVTASGGIRADGVVLADGIVLADAARAYRGDNTACMREE